MIDYNMFFLSTSLCRMTRLAQIRIAYILFGVILSDALCELPCVHEPASCYKRVVSGLYIHTVETTYNLSET